MPSVAGVLVQYPMYAGMVKMMTESGLASRMAHFFVDVSTQHSYPLLVGAYVVTGYPRFGGAAGTIGDSISGVQPAARYHGRALTQGAPRDLMSGLAGRVLELATEQGMAARQIAVEDPDVEDVHTFGEYLHLRVRSAEGPLERLPKRLTAAGVPLAHLIPVAPSLEDVFIQLLEMDEQTNGQ